MIFFSIDNNNACQSSQSFFYGIESVCIKQSGHFAQLLRRCLQARCPLFDPMGIIHYASLSLPMLSSALSRGGAWISLNTGHGKLSICASSIYFRVTSSSTWYWLKSHNYSGESGLRERERKIINYFYKIESGVFSYVSVASWSIKLEQIVGSKHIIQWNTVYSLIPCSIYIPFITAIKHLLKTEMIHL